MNAKRFILSGAQKGFGGERGACGCAQGERGARSAFTLGDVATATLHGGSSANVAPAPAAFCDVQRGALPATLRRGFTLAEVLITLAIIGVVAVLSIGIYMPKIQSNVWAKQRFYVARSCL